MYTTQLLAAALASISLSVAVAVPAPIIAPFVAAGSVRPTGGFTVGQIPKRVAIRNGAIEMRKAFRKYGKPVPLHLAMAAATANSNTSATRGTAVNTFQTGNVDAIAGDPYDSEYVCLVQIGSTGQKVLLDFDTGSSDLWVFYSGQPASQRSGHDYYSPSKSTSAVKRTGETWNIAYADNSGARGIVYSDKVVIGRATATSQAVECATSISSKLLSDTSNDGLLGLGFPNINTVSPKQVLPFFQTIQSSLPSPVFTAALKYHAPGSYDFGYINASKYSGPITYTTVNPANGYWEFNIDGYAIGSGAKSKITADTICDTGTTLIYLPASTVTAYYKKVAGSQNSYQAGGYIFPCSATLPSFTVYISGVRRIVPGNYIKYAPYYNNMCFGGIQSNDGMGLSILGDIFIKSQFVVFDVGNTRIGFATPAQS